MGHGFWQASRSRSERHVSPNLTFHARARMQQRCIRTEALDALLDFGGMAYVDRGREIVFFDKAARARLARHNPLLAKEAERIRRTAYPQAEMFAAQNVLQPPSEAQMLAAFGGLRA